jgi:cysteine desulfurase
MNSDTPRIYLDHSATTPIHPQVAEAMAEVLSRCYGNPSSIHFLGRESRIIIEKARKSMAHLLGCSPAEIFFTSGGTESDNMACRCAVENLGIRRIISSPLEHHAITHVLEQVHKVYGTEICWLGNDFRGLLDMDQLESWLAESSSKGIPTLVTLMHGNNEIGNMLDVARVASLCKSQGALFHSDMVQTVGHYPLNFTKLGLDMASGSAHKFYGPKGIGFIYIRGGIQLGSLMAGGSQERNMRGGTENLPGIAGMGLALDLAVSSMEERRDRITRLRTRLMEGIRKTIPGVTFNGDTEGASMYQVLSVSFPPHPKGEMLLFHLDIEGICASGGSACSSGAESRSHVLNGIGMAKDRTAVRFSLGARNTEEEIDRTIDILRQILLQASADSMDPG